MDFSVEQKEIPVLCMCCLPQNGALRIHLVFASAFKKEEYETKLSNTSKIGHYEL
jgi:hypothetical protein